MVPMLLHHFGSIQYGLYAALTSIVGYFTLLTFGSALAVPRYVAEHAARGDNRALGEFVSTYLAAHAVVAVLGFAVAFGIAPLLTRVLDVPPDMRSMVAPAFRLVAAGWALGLAAGLLQSLLTGLGDVGLANLAASARTLLNLLAVFIAIRVNGDLQLLLVALMSSSLAGSVMVALLVRRRHPGIPISPRLAGLATLRSTRVSAGYYWLMQVAAVVVMGTDNIIIGAFAGVGSVAAYAVAFQLWSLALAILWSGIDALQPFISRWNVEKEHARLRMGYLLATRYTFAGGAIAAIVLIWLGPAIVHLWVGTALVIDRSLLTVFAAMLLTATPIHTAALMLAGLGKHRPVALGGAAEAALNLVLSLILVRTMGVPGVALGTLISGVLTNAWVAPRAANRELGIGFADYARQALMPGLVPAAIAAVLAAVLR